MKCKNCGYISTREFYRCPYCGQVHESENDILKTRLSFGGGFSIRIRTILYGFLVNVFGIAVMLDWFLDFKYSITLWAFIACFGTLLLISIAFMKRKSIYTIAERIDFFVLISLILCAGLCRIKGVFDIRPYFVSFAIPGYMLFTTFFSVLLLFMRKRSTALRPVITELLLLFHALIATTLFVFLLVNKYSVMNGASNPAFSWMQFGMTKDNITPLYLVEEILIFAAFGASWAYFINYNLILVGFIYRKVRNIYGGDNGD